MTDSTSDREDVIWGPLGDWEVTLTTGHVLTIAAHSYSEENGAYVFSILMRGKPGDYVNTVRVPAEIVATVYGG